MTYVDGYVLAVPTANRAAYQKIAEDAAILFKEYGALKVVECWGDDVPEGKLTSVSKEICDTSKSAEVLVALSCESRVEVDEIVAKAIAAGGSTYNDPKDHGFMYQHGFQDLDGHIWEIFFMDESAIEASP